MPCKFHPHIQTSHLCAVSKGDGGVSIVSTRCQQVTNDGWYLRQGTKDQRLSTPIHTWAQGEHALLTIREVVRTEGLSSKLQQVVPIIITRETLDSC